MQEFEALPDPRRTHSCVYPLQEMLLVALCAISSDADDWVHVAEWGELKLGWLRRFLPFASGIASHDTFSRVFALLDAVQFSRCFTLWMAQLCPTLAGQSIASAVFDAVWNLRNPMDLVVWLGANRSNAGRHCEDLQRRQAAKDAGLCSTQCRTLR